MDKIEAANPVRYCLNMGIAVKSLGDAETAILGGTRVVYLRGPSQLVVKFIGEFGNSNGKTLSEALNFTDEVPDQNVAKQMREGLTMIFNGLADCGALRQVSGSTPDLKRESIQVCGRLSVSIKDIFIHSPFDFIETALAALPNDYAGRLLAYNLNEHELHEINRYCIEHGISWIFAFFTRGEAFISPILKPGTGPCYQCMRLRRIGSIPDVITNTMIEHRLMQSPFEINMAMEPDFISELRAAAAILQNIAQSGALGANIFTCITRNGGTKNIDLLRMPGCLACDGATKASANAHA